MSCTHSACGMYGQFKCENQMCLDNTKRCNTVDDCGDNSDERNCTSECTSDATGSHAPKSYDLMKPSIAEFTEEIIEEPRDALYALSIILTCLCSFLAVTFVLLILFCCVEWKAKHLCMGETHYLVHDFGQT